MTGSLVSLADEADYIMRVDTLSSSACGMNRMPFGIEIIAGWNDKLFHALLARSSLIHGYETNDM